MIHKNSDVKIMFVQPISDSLCLVQLIDTDGKSVSRPITEGFLAFKLVNFDLLSHYRQQLILGDSSHNLPILTAL